MKRLRLKLQTALGDELMRKIIGGGFAAFAIKVGSAGLSFLMFVALARVMSKPDYGVFAFGFSLATFLALLALMGQRSLALRFIPIYAAGEAPGALRGLLLFGYATVLAASVAVCGTLILLGPLVLADGGRSVALSALLVVPMALSDYQSGVYRGLGMIGAALVPRDVLWRIGSILACLPALAGWRELPLGEGFGAEVALALSAAILMGLVLLQLATRREAVRIMLSKERAVFHLAQWRHATLGLWVNDMLQTGAQNVAVVLLGLALAPEATGGLFAAIKTAALLNFFLLAANIVSAPQISRLWHAQALGRLKRVCAIVTLGATIPTLALFLVYVFGGRRILELFGAGYASAYPSLILLSLGQLISTMCGQTGVLMTMTGHERKLTRFIFLSNVIPLAVLPFGVMAFGEVFGALAIAAGMTLWNVQAVIWGRRMGVDTSILGALALVLRRPA